MKRSAEVEELLEKKNGYFLTYGNMAVILFIIVGIIASQKIEYPVYKNYNLTRVPDGFSNTGPDYFIKIPFSDLRQYNLKENQSLVFIANENQNLQIGTLGHQLDSKENEGSFELIITDNSLIENYDSKDSIITVLISIDRTSLFEQFSSQFKKNITTGGD